MRAADPHQKFQGVPPRESNVFENSIEVARKKLVATANWLPAVIVAIDDIYWTNGERILWAVKPQVDQAYKILYGFWKRNYQIKSMKHNMVLFANVTACLQAIWSYFTSTYYYHVW